jgi:molybdopterin molybdotransferase
MLSVDEALNNILNNIGILEEEERLLLECMGQVLAQDIYASFNVPGGDNSAMDGYAVQAASIIGAKPDNPKILKVIGEVAAGAVADFKVGYGEAVRIMTGAFIPQGADAVVPFEDTDETERKKHLQRSVEIGIHQELKKGINIRKSGEDVAKGDLVVKKGRMLTAAEIGVLASIGKVKVPVVRRPMVGILATGNEVVSLGEDLPLGKLYNSNTYSIAAQVLECGGIPKVMGIAPDTIDGLTAALRQGLDYDLLITSGGVSMGDYDMVKNVLAAEGDIKFWTVRMKPGKPLAFGSFKRDDGKRVPHLGLPGNPVSSMVTFQVFARPAIFKMMGKGEPPKLTIKAVMEDPVKNADGRRIFTRVVLSKKEGKYFARLTGQQGSGILTSMIKANALAIIPETTAEVKAGTDIEVIVLDWDRILDS